MTRELALAILYELQKERVKQIQTRHFHESKDKAISNNIIIMLPSENEVNIILNTWKDLQPTTEYAIAANSDKKKEEIMPTLENVDPSYQFYMFKGEPGTRKSTAALSFPEPQYWFNWDRKMQSMLVPMNKWGLNPKNYIYEDYDDWDKARMKLEQMTINCKHPDGRKYETLVFDSLTSAMDMTLRQTLNVKKGTNKKFGQAAGKQIAGIAVNEIEDYNAESSAMNELISLAKDIQGYHKLNIILIAHVMEVSKFGLNGETSVTRTIVTAGKRVAAKLPGYCSEVYHFDIEKSLSESLPGNYSIITENTGDDFARTGLDLPRRIVFNNEPLYSKHILPAIDKLKGNNVMVKF